MRSAICVGLLFVGLVWGIDDFSDNLQGYSIIYHDHHDLLLVNNSTDCYYVQILNFFKGQLSEGYLRERTEQIIINIIEYNDDAPIRPTTLGDMRSKHRDLLADYHCVNKHVFEIISIEGMSVFHG